MSDPWNMVGLYRGHSAKRHGAKTTARTAWGSHTAICRGRLTMEFLAGEGQVRGKVDRAVVLDARKVNARRRLPGIGRCKTERQHNAKGQGGKNCSDVGKHLVHASTMSAPLRSEFDEDQTAREVHPHSATDVGGWQGRRSPPAAKSGYYRVPALSLASAIQPLKRWNSRAKVTRSSSGHWPRASANTFHL